MFRDSKPELYDYVALLERMKMEHLLAQLDGVCEHAAKGDLDYKGFLTHALEAEWRGRHQRGVESRLKLARLPWLKSLDQASQSDGCSNRLVGYYRVL
jgi:hypothetical protein